MVEFGQSIRGPVGPGWALVRGLSRGSHRTSSGARLALELDAWVFRAGSSRASVGPIRGLWLALCWRIAATRVGLGKASDLGPCGLGVAQRGPRVGPMLTPTLWLGWSKVWAQPGQRWAQSTPHGTHGTGRAEDSTRTSLPRARRVCQRKTDRQPSYLHAR